MRSVFDAYPEEILIDSLTEDEWVVVKYYQIDNYDFLKIKRDDKVRKISLFKKPDSINDANRYIFK